MTLHVDSSTIRNQTVLAHVLDPVDPSTDGDSGSGGQAGTSSATTDSAAISANGQRLAAIGVDHVRRAERDRRRRVVRALARRAPSRRAAPARRRCTARSTARARPHCSSTERSHASGSASGASSYAWNAWVHGGPGGDVETAGGRLARDRDDVPAGGQAGDPSSACRGGTATPGCPSDRVAAPARPRACRGASISSSSRRRRLPSRSSSPCLAVGRGPGPRSGSCARGVRPTGRGARRRRVRARTPRRRPRRRRP